MSDITLKEKTGELLAQEPPHYYEVKLENHPNGLKQMHCGTMRDLESVLSMNPGATWEKIYLPHTPQTVDVPYVRVAPDQELPMQQVLPESQWTELNT